jgi:hypothetical protein
MINSVHFILWAAGLRRAISQTTETERAAPATEFELLEIVESLAVIRRRASE